MQSINEDIKNGEFKQVYLLYGAEAYLRKQYRDKLKQALVAQDDTMNCHYYEGKDISFGEIIDLAETMPFFTDRRVIIIENSNICKQGGEQMADYLKAISESSLFIIVEEEIDKRSRIFKTIKETGRAVEFAVQDENTLKKWVRGLLAKESKTISESVLNSFFEKTGNDMEHIKSELEKLVCYTLGKTEINGADVEAICTVRVSNRIFDMINAIADKKQKTALNFYYDLLELKEPPMRILFLIARQFNLLLQVKELKDKHYDNKTIADKTGLHSFVVSKYMQQASKFSKKDLREALTACVAADEAVKTGKMNDRMSVEMLIVRYSI